MVELFANSGHPDQMSHLVVIDLGLHCLAITFLGVSRLQWFKAPVTTSSDDIFLHISFFLRPNIH